MFVYLVTFDDIHFKIGRSRKSPYERLPTLQTGSPFKMKVVRWVSTKTKRDKSLENELHEKFSDARCLGEWFKLGEGGPEKFDEAVKELTGSPSLTSGLPEDIVLTDRGIEIRNAIESNIVKKNTIGFIPGIGRTFFDRKNMGEWVSFTVDLIAADYKLNSQASKSGIEWKLNYLDKAMRRCYNGPPDRIIGGGTTNYTVVLKKDLHLGTSLVASLLSDEANLQKNHV